MTCLECQTVPAPSGFALCDSCVPVVYGKLFGQRATKTQVLKKVVEQKQLLNLAETIIQTYRNQAFCGGIIGTARVNERTVNECDEWLRRKQACG